MTNHANRTIDEDTLRRALQRGTDRTAASSPAMWNRILDAHANGGNARRHGAKAWIALGATALTAAALVITLPRWLSVPDVVRPPVLATAQPSATVAAQQTPLTASNPLDGRFAQAANGDTSLSKLYADVLAMVQAKDSNAPAAVSQLMETLLAQQPALSASLNAMTNAENGGPMYMALIQLKGKTKLNDSSVPTKEQKAVLEELFAAGYTVGLMDTSVYAQVRYAYFQQQFSAALDDELRAYLSLCQKEADKPYQEEGMLYVSTEELANRYLAAQDYLSKYGESAQGKAQAHPWRTLEISYLNNGYLSALFTLSGSLFSGTDNMVPQEYRDAFDAEIAALQGSHGDLAAMLKEFRTLLQSNGWKLTDEINRFLQEHNVPGFSPAPRLIWAELSIYGVRLDSDGETAIPKLTAAIGAQPASDSTAEDAGGSTRTVTWSNGTIATIRNGKVYALEATAAVAPLVRGLAIGDPTETVIAYLGQPLHKGDVWTWGVGSNDNIFGWFTNNQLVRLKISLTE